MGNYKSRSLRTILLAALLSLASVAQATIIFTMTPGAGGAVDMNIQASGSVTANSHTWLLIGDPTNDSFVNSGVVSSGNSAPTPSMTLGPYTALNSFYRDDNGSSLNGVQSLLGFFFGFNDLNGVLDLSDLNGDYFLPDAVFSHFIAGTHTGLVAGASTGDHLQNLGDVTVRVLASQIPAPASLFLLGAGVAGIGFARRKKLA